jgi:hypothetical protein
METTHRRIVFIILLTCILVVLGLRSLKVIEGADAAAATATTAAAATAAATIPVWVRNDNEKNTSCPIIVSQCILPGMVSDLNKKIQDKLDLVELYTKEIVDIESRYPITFQINRVDISDISSNTYSGSNQRMLQSWVTGVLPYPQLSFTFPKPIKGKDGEKGPQGNVGLSLPPTTRIPPGLTGPAGYYGVAKE